MAYKLSIAPAALGDIAHAARWYDTQQARFGDIFLLATQDVFASIRRNPEMYPVVVDDIHRALFPRFPYAAMYRRRDSIIQIIAIMHHRQHPDTLLTRAKNP